MSACGPQGRLAWSAIVLEVFLGVGALGGGVALILGPRGEVLPLPVSALAGSPFRTYLVPGVVLFFVIGIGPLVAAALTWRRHRWAPFLAMAVGVALLVWMAVEIAIVGYTNTPPLQATYLILGAVIGFVGICWQRSSRETP